jgi:hypothetical protein
MLLNDTLSLGGMGLSKLPRFADKRMLLVVIIVGLCFEWGRGQRDSTGRQLGLDRVVSGSALLLNILLEERNVLRIEISDICCNKFDKTDHLLRPRLQKDNFFKLLRMFKFYFPPIFFLDQHNNLNPHLFFILISKNTSKSIP